MNSLAILGCASSVGKSTIVIALCRYYSNKNVIPFKALNLSSEGFNYNEYFIGYAQYIQSLAAKKNYNVKSNPILKRYCTDGMKTYVNGFLCNELNVDYAKNVIDGAYTEIANKSELVIVEGSGSIGELNLKNCDVANIAFALKNRIPVIIVADISKGGVFGTLYGHLQLLNDSERSLIKGIIINKFSGDSKHFSKGVKILEELCETKVLGVIPRIDFELPEEDTINNSVKYDSGEIEKNIEILTKNVISNLDIEYLSKIILEGCD
ncbi:MAG: AAA family ATPase [Bacilli bacterium]